MKLFIPLLILVSLFVNCSKDDDSTTGVIDNDPDTAIVNDDETDGTDDDGESVELTSEQKRLVEEFNYRAFNKSRRSPNEFIRKWKVDMKILLSGSLTNNQREIIKSFIDQLNGINSKYNIELTSSNSDFNTEIYTSSAKDYIKDRPNFIPGFKPEGAYPSGSSNVLYEVASKKIYSSLIWIENPNDFFVRDVKREILFSLGLGATEDSTSIIYSFFNEVSTLTADDIFVIRTLCNPLIEPGFNESQVYSVIQKNITSFF